MPLDKLIDHRFHAAQPSPAYHALPHTMDHAALLTGPRARIWNHNSRAESLRERGIAEMKQESAVDKRVGEVHARAEMVTNENL